MRSSSRIGLVNNTDRQTHRGISQEYKLYNKCFGVQHASCANRAMRLDIEGSTSISCWHSTAPEYITDALSVHFPTMWLEMVALSPSVCISSLDLVPTFHNASKDYSLGKKWHVHVPDNCACDVNLTHYTLTHPYVCVLPTRSAVGRI